MREAVTAVLVHRDECFVIQRQPHLRAFPGYLAFPGGKVDDADHHHTFSHPLLQGFPGAQMRALCRELQEELDFDLLRAVEQGEVLELSELGVAITPPFERYRFKAHHFRVALERRPTFSPDSNEIAWSAWCSPGAIWQRYQMGEWPMVVPTRNVIKTLADSLVSRRVEPFNLHYDPARQLPLVELVHRLPYLPVPSPTLPPARFTNALLVDGCLVDPSPEDPQTLELLLASLPAGCVSSLLISHHHPDHHRFAPEIARRLGVPLRCSVITERRLGERYGDDYLAGVTIERVAEGDVVGRWQDQPVRCYALPGHDDGMLGLAPCGLAWFFVSDLVQTAGTVVIPEPEGDMDAYLASLERVIELRPGIVVPSHGMPCGGTWLLSQTLAHRHQREQQVRQLHDAGKPLEEMLSIIYPQLAEGLVPLAAQATWFIIIIR